MCKIVIAGIDETDGSFKNTYASIYKGPYSIWNGTYINNDVKYDVNNIITSSDLSSVCIDNGTVDLGKDEAVKEKLMSANILVFVSNPDTYINYACSVLSNLNKIDFSNVSLVIFANSYSNSLELSFEDFYKYNLTALFPNALIIGFGKQNGSQFKTVIELINSKCVSNFILSSQKQDVANIIGDSEFIALLSNSQTPDYFWCNKDYVGGDILKTYDLDKYSFLTKKLSDVVKSWWNYKDIIPYVIYYKELTGNELEIVNKIISEDKSFYNNAVLVTKDGKKCIQGKVHYSFVDKYIEAKYNYSKSDIKNCLKEAHVGVDCSGLVSPILFETVEEIKMDNNYKEVVKSLDSSNQLWGIKRHDAIVIKEKGSIIVRSVKNVRPGDIMRTCENYSGSFHIRLVIDVKHHDDGSVEIQTIESAYDKGLKKKIYLFKYNEKNKSYDLTVDNEAGKDFYIKTKITEVTINSYSGQHIEGQLIVNTTHYATPIYIDSFKKENDEYGFDHVLDSFGKTYYFRRPKFLHSLVSRLSGGSAPVVDDGITEGGSMNLLTPDEKQQIKELAADIIEIGIKHIQSYKIADYVKKTVVSAYISDFSKLGKFAQAASIYTYKKKRLDDLVDNMFKISDGLIESWDTLPDIILADCKEHGRIMDSDELIRQIHKNVFGVEYDKQAIDLANDYFIIYLVAYRCNEFKQLIKNKMSSIRIKFMESVVPFSDDIKAFDSYVTELYYQSEDVRKLMLSVLSDISKFNISGFYDLEEKSSEKLSTKQIEGIIYKLFNSLDSVIQFSDELRNRAGIYSLKAFGFDYPSIIEFEKAAIADSEFNGGLLKAFSCVILSIGIGSLVGAITVGFSLGAQLAIGVTFDTIFSSVGVDIFDLYSTKISTKEKAQQIVFNAIISSLFSVAAAKFMPAGLKFVKLKYNEIRAYFSETTKLLKNETLISVIFSKGALPSFSDSTVNNLFYQLKKDMSDVIKLMDTQKIAEALEVVKKDKALLKPVSEIAEDVTPKVKEIKELTDGVESINQQIADLKEKAKGSKYYDDFGADKHYLDWNEESLKKMSDTDKNGLFYSEQARRLMIEKAGLELEISTKTSVLDSILKQKELNAKLVHDMSATEFLDGFMKDFSGDNVMGVLASTEQKLAKFEEAIKKLQVAEEGKILANKEFEKKLETIGKSIKENSASYPLLEAYQNSYKVHQGAVKAYAEELDKLLNSAIELGADMNQLEALANVLSPTVYNAMMLTVGNTDLLNDRSVEEVVLKNFENILSKDGYTLPEDTNLATIISGFLHSLEKSIFVNFNTSFFLGNVEELKVISYIDDFDEALKQIKYPANSPKDDYMYISSCIILINNLFENEKITQEQLNSCYKNWKNSGKTYVYSLLIKLLEYGFVVYGQKYNSIMLEFFIDKTMVAIEDFGLVKEAEKLAKLANELLKIGSIDSNAISLFRARDKSGLSKYVSEAAH